MLYKTILEAVLKHFPTLWKNGFFRHIIFIGSILLILNLGKDYQPISTALSLFQDSNTKQLKLILTQTEQERDEYKKKEMALNAEFLRVKAVKDSLSKERDALWKKTTSLEKELERLRNLPLIIPSTDKHVLSQQFTDLGFEAVVKECR